MKPILQTNRLRRSLLANLCLCLVICLCIFSPISLRGQNTATKIEVLEEKVQQSQDQAKDALKTAREAKEEAALANKNSDQAKELSGTRFSQVQNYLNIISVIAGILLAIAAFFEFTRRRADHLRFQKLMERQEKLDTFQMDLSEKTQAQSASIVKEQISSLTDLSGVIKLVDETFKLKIDETKGKEKKIEELKQMNMDLKLELGVFASHFEKMFQRIEGNLEGFADMSRMEWTKLKGTELKLLETSRNSFESIPEAILKRVEKQDQVIETYYRLGMGAFYSNQITDALSMFEGGKRFFEEWEPKKNSREANDKKKMELVYAFSIHYLGLIEKNWLPNGNDAGKNLVEAKKHLIHADQLLAHREKEFMTPVTLLEIMTYIPPQRNEAKKKLDEIWEKFREVKKNGELDANQKKLYGRCFLLQGNLEYQIEELENAAISYQKAINENPNSYYAIFSKALIEKKLGRDDVASQFKEGLEIMEQVKALEKPETTTKGTLLAWAVIAAYHSDSEDKGHYEKLLLNFKSNLRKHGNRSALFFSPSTKKLVSIEDLIEDVYKECNPHGSGGGMNG